MRDIREYAAAGNQARKLVERITRWLMLEEMEPGKYTEKSIPDVNLNTRIDRLQVQIIPKDTVPLFRVVQHVGNDSSHDSETSSRVHVEAAISALNSIVSWFESTYLGVAESSPPRLSKLEPNLFSGRSQQFVRVWSLFREGVNPVVISGPTGMGKSELSYQYADRYRAEYPSGTERIDSADSTDVLRQIQRIFRRNHIVDFVADIKPRPKDDAAAAQRYWEHWRPGRCLLIFDNVLDDQIDAIRAFFPDVQQDFDVLVTSQWVWPVRGNYPLDVLTSEEAVEFFRAFLGEKRVEGQEDKVLEVAKWLGFLPLALELTARYMLRFEKEQFSTVFTRLQSEGVAGSVLATPGTAVQRNWMFAFKLFWGGAPDRDRDLLHLVASFPPGPVQTSFVKQVYDRVNQPIAKRSLEDAERSLVVWNILKFVPEWEAFEIHDLIRRSIRYTTGLDQVMQLHLSNGSHTFDQAADLREALHDLMYQSALTFMDDKGPARLEDWHDYVAVWAQVATCKAIVQDPLHSIELLLAASEYRNDQGAALELLYLTDRPELGIDSLQSHLPARASELAHRLRHWRANALRIVGRYNEAVSLLQQIRLDPKLTPVERGRIMLQEADVERLQGSYIASAVNYSEAVELMRATPTDVALKAVEADAEYGLARIARLTGNHAGALDAYRKARSLLDDCTTDHKKVKLGWAEFGLGEAHRLRWELDQSVVHYDLAAEAFGKNLEGQSYAEWGRGECHRLGGRLRDARSSYEQSLQHCTSTGDIRSKVWAIIGVGCVSLASRDLENALSIFKGADAMVKEEVERAHLLLCQGVAIRKLRAGKAEDFAECMRVYSDRSMTYCIVQVLINQALSTGELHEARAHLLDRAEEFAIRHSYTHELDIIHLARAGKDGFVVNLP